MHLFILSVFVCPLFHFIAPLAAVTLVSIWEMVEIVFYPSVGRGMFFTRMLYVCMLVCMSVNFLITSYITNG